MLYIVTYINGCGDHTSALIEAEGPQEARELAALEIPEAKAHPRDTYVTEYKAPQTTPKGRVLVVEDYDHEAPDANSPFLPIANWNNSCWNNSCE